MKKNQKQMTGAESRKSLNAKITEKVWDKETDRFATMTEKQLKTRLFKITNPVKMEAFRQVAKQYGYRKLSRLAAEKRNFFVTA